MSVDVGARFPTTVTLDSARGPVTLAQLLVRGPLVIAFHRMWCPFCQQAARDLAATKDEFDALGAQVVIVYREDAQTAEQSCGQRGIPFACLSDPERDLEHAADVTRFTLRRYLAFSPAKVFGALRTGSRLGVSPDFLQGRGTFVIDQSGRVVYAHRAVNAADIPSVAEIVSATREAAGGNLQR